MRCKKIDGMSRLARCDKLLKKKNNEARRAEEQQQQDEDQVEVGDGDEKQQQQDEDQVEVEDGDEEQQQQDGDQDEVEAGEECKDDKTDKIMKHRTQQYSENPRMMIDGDDFQLVMDCDHCGPSVTECLLIDCDECGKSWVREDYVLSVIGNDVISLFPSLDTRQCKYW
jgi:hypothetical protein